MDSRTWLGAGDGLHRPSQSQSQSQSQSAGYQNGRRTDDSESCPQIFAKPNTGRTAAAMAAGYADEEIMDEDVEYVRGRTDPDEILVVEEGKALLGDLIINEMSRDLSSPETKARIRQQVQQSAQSFVFTPRAVGRSTSLAQQEQIVSALAKIGDALEADRELNAMITRVPEEASWETFQNVAALLFADGVNWGRIVALLYFACKMVHRAIQRSLSNIPMISLILDWASKIIKLYLAKWIVQRGGWRGVVEWFGPTWGQIGMTFGPPLAAICVYVFLAGRVRGA